MRTHATHPVPKASIQIGGVGIVAGVWNDLLTISDGWNGDSVVVYALPEQFEILERKDDE